jgi:hypothetical protein
MHLREKQERLSKINNFPGKEKGLYCPTGFGRTNTLVFFLKYRVHPIFSRPQRRYMNRASELLRAGS